MKSAVEIIKHYLSPEEAASLGEEGIQKAAKAAIRLARFHVNHALTSAAYSANVIYTDLTSDSLVEPEVIKDIFYHEDIEAEIDKDSILNCYPKSNIV